jgi:hypothetical protein
LLHTPYPEERTLNKKENRKEIELKIIRNRKEKEKKPKAGYRIKKPLGLPPHLPIVRLSRFQTPPSFLQTFN